MTTLDDLALEIRETILYYTWLSTPSILMLEIDGLVHLANFVRNSDLIVYEEESSAHMESSNAEDCEQDEFEEEEDEPADLPVGLPSWLLTNRAMLTVCMDVFNRHGECLMEIDTIMPREYPREAPTNEDASLYDHRIFSPLIAPHTVPRLRVVLYKLGRNTFKNPTPMIDLSPDHIEYCEALFKHITACTNVREVELCLKPFFHSLRPVEVNLDAFDDLVRPLASLSRLQVEIPTSWHDRVTPKERDEVEGQLLEKLRGTGEGALAGMERDPASDFVKEEDGRPGVDRYLHRDWKFVWTSVGSV